MPMTDYSKWRHEEPIEYSKKLEKAFGPPDEATDTHTIWYGKDGFKKIVVRDEYILHGSPDPHYDFVYSYIDLKVSPMLGTALAQSSESIFVDFLKGEVGARCGTLSANAHTLNYVMDVVYERVKPSKEEYEKRIRGIKAGTGPDWWSNTLKEEVSFCPICEGKTAELIKKSQAKRGAPGTMKRKVKGKMTIAKARALKNRPGATTSDKRQANFFINMHSEEKVLESLKDWFGKGPKGDWVRVDTKGKIKGACAREPGEGKPKCMPRSKAHSMSKKDRGSAARRKRAADPQVDRPGTGNKPINVRTESVEYIEEKSKPNNPKLWSRAKSLARSKFDVYPSAYANGWAAKWYKSKGGTWRSAASESVLMTFKEKCWDGYRQAGMKKKGAKMVPNCVPEENIDEIAPLIGMAARAVARPVAKAVGGMATRAVAAKAVSTAANYAAKKQSDRQKVDEDDMKGMSVSSGHKRSVKQGAGMTKKGVAAYRRRNPGSKLGTAVTTPPSKLKAGSKAAGRRKSFCARSRSWTGPRGKAARRRWNC